MWEEGLSFPAVRSADDQTHTSSVKARERLSSRELRAATPSVTTTLPSEHHLRRRSLTVPPLRATIEGVQNGGVNVPEQPLLTG